MYCDYSTLYSLFILYMLRRRRETKQAWRARDASNFCLCFGMPIEHGPTFSSLRPPLIRNYSPRSVISLELCFLVDINQCTLSVFAGWWANYVNPFKISLSASRVNEFVPFKVHFDINEKKEQWPINLVWTGKTADWTNFSLNVGIAAIHKTFNGQQSETVCKGNEWCPLRQNAITSIQLARSSYYVWVWEVELIWLKKHSRSPKSVKVAICMLFECIVLIWSNAMHKKIGMISMFLCLQVMQGHSDQVNATMSSRAAARRLGLSYAPRSSLASKRILCR